MFLFKKNELNFSFSSVLILIIRLIIRKFELFEFFPWMALFSLWACEKG